MRKPTTTRAFSITSANTRRAVVTASALDAASTLKATSKLPARFGPIQPLSGTSASSDANSAACSSGVR